MTAVNDKNREIISRRWAKALIELVLEEKTLSREDVLKDLRETAAVIDSSKELTNVINNPSISIEEKQIVLCKLFQDRLMPIVYNFIFTLNLRKRLDLLSEIAEQFSRELEIANNISHVKITSAIELSAKQREEIKNKISAKLGKNVITDWNTDSEIIGGLIFNIDETIIDNSIKHKLDDIREKIVLNIK